MGSSLRKENIVENLARREYDSDVNKKVKEELQIAGIPVVNIGRLDNEVKTNYIGILKTMWLAIPLALADG